MDTKKKWKEAIFECQCIMFCYIRSFSCRHIMYLEHISSVPCRLLLPSLPAIILPPLLFSPSSLSFLSFPLVPPSLYTSCFYFHVICSCVILHSYKAYVPQVRENMIFIFLKLLNLLRIISSCICLSENGTTSPKKKKDHFYIPSLVFSCTVPWFYFFLSI